MRYIFLFATSCYSSLSACCCGVCCCCCCCCVSQAVWVTNDKTKTCRGAVCDDDKDLVVRWVSLSLAVSLCGIQGAACNKLQCQWQWQLLLDWSTNLAYCTTFHRKRQTLRLVHANCTLIDFRCMFCLHFDCFIRCRCSCALLLLFLLLLLLPLLSLASLCDPKLNKWLFSAEPRQMASHRTRNSEADFVCFQRSAATFFSLLLLFL